MSSDAVAHTVTVPLSVAPAPGLVNVTVGAAVSFDTVTLTILEPWLPAASRATAVSTCVPLDTARRRPRQLVGRGGVFSAERTVIQQKPDARHADVIGGGRRHENAPEENAADSGTSW